MLQISVLLVLFCVTQVAAMLLFKMGSLHTGPGMRARWAAYWIAGNLVGTGSVVFMVKMYELMPHSPNLVTVLGMSSVFIACQLVFALWFRSSLTRLQWAGIAIVAAGTVLTCIG